MSAIKDGSEINMGKFTPFEWDKFYVFGPYATEQHINDMLGFKWSGSGPDQDEYQLIIFVKESKVVCNFLFPRYKPSGDFLPANVYTHNDAVFIIKNNALMKKPHGV